MSAKIKKVPHGGKNWQHPRLASDVPETCGYRLVERSPRARMIEAARLKELRETMEDFP